MNALGTEVLGIAFLLVGTAATFLMFYQWGFSYDKDLHRSEAPPWVTLSLRILGYLYLFIYLYMMWAMIPRLWTYQVELPARTVAHLVLGIAIGAILILKISIVRFFKYLEKPLVPMLGVGLFICTVILVGLAIPSYAREAYLNRAAFSPERQARLDGQIERAGLTDPTERLRIASSDGLQRGREVLLDQCVQCHDLRTVLVKPRTPANWRSTVERMANRSAFVAPIEDDDQWRVTAYLIAISPTLQKTAQLERQQQQATDQARLAVHDALSEESGADPQEAKELFEFLCTQCHDLEEVEAWPPEDDEEIRELVERMVDNGLEASEYEMAQLMRHMNERYVSK